MLTHGTFDVKISLAKGIIFTKIGLANGTILKLLATHPYLKFSGEPPPPRVRNGVNCGQRRQTRTAVVVVVLSAGVQIIHHYHLSWSEFQCETGSSIHS